MKRTEKILRGRLLSVKNSRTKEGARNDGQILYQRFETTGTKRVSCTGVWMWQ